LFVLGHEWTPFCAIFLSGQIWLIKIILHLFWKNNKRLCLAPQILFVYFDVQLARQPLLSDAPVREKKAMAEATPF